MTRLGLLAFVSFVSFGSFAACSSNSAPAVTPDVGVDALTVDQACTAVSSARCMRLAACSSADLDRRWGEIAACEMREQLSCDDALGATGTGATPAGTLGCSSALAAQTCSEFLGLDPPDACLAATGPGAAGSTCAFPAQCASAFCAIADTAVCGTCEPAPLAGDSCAASGCGPTMTCVAATQLCQVPVAAAGACSRSMPCADGLACVGATMATTGTCMAQATTIGATCDALRKVGPNCSADQGLDCDSATSQCVTQPIAAVNAPCGAIGTTTTRCNSAATCVIANGQTVGTCLAPAADGAACDTAAGPGCLFPAKCVTAGTTAGTCKLPGEASCS